MNWLQKILEALGLGELFGWLGKRSEGKNAQIPMQEVAIRENANTDAIKELRKQDRIQDKDLLREPKILYHFDDFPEYAKSISMIDNERPLYYGDKESILRDIKKDWARILTRKYQRQFKRLVKDSDKPYFVIKIHPLTIHK